jgi:hypothetical protein
LFIVSGDFISLWQTLEKWAIKAKDEEKWQTEILKLAEQEPEALKPFEREYHLQNNQ